MKKEWKRFTALALGAFMVLQAAGCSPQKGGRSSYGKQPEGGADVWRGFKGIFRGEEEEKTVTLRMLNWGNTEEAIANDAIGRFKEKHPGVEVEQTCVPVDSLVRLYPEVDYHEHLGEAPDVINLGLEGAKMAVANDLLLPLDDIAAGCRITE